MNTRSRHNTIRVTTQTGDTIVAPRSELIRPDPERGIHLCDDCDELLSGRPDDGVCPACGRRNTAKKFVGQMHPAERVHHVGRGNTD